MASQCTVPCHRCGVPVESTVRRKRLCPDCLILLQKECEVRYRTSARGLAKSWARQQKYRAAHPEAYRESLRRYTHSEKNLERARARSKTPAGRRNQLDYRIRNAERVDILEA